MIATHSSKVFNARIKQEPVLADIRSVLPNNFISSQSTKMRRKLWAVPLNAADIKRAKEKIASMSEKNFEHYLPNISDTNIKQLLLPYNSGYVCMSPVTSLGVLHEVYNRLGNAKVPFMPWTIQPTPAAIANHGETLLAQGGRVRLFKRFPRKIEKSDWKGSFVQLTARCEHMSISSGMLAVGFPAITAIGGAVHVLERAVGQKIDFALGLNNLTIDRGVPRINLLKGKTGFVTGRGATKNTSPTWGYSLEEITGSCEIVLLLKSDSALSLIAEHIKSLNRIAGGSLFDLNISIIDNNAPVEASYLIDASDKMDIKQRFEAEDSLDTALRYYKTDGDLYQTDRNFTINQTGYAFLESPKERRNVRNQEYKHAWAEPIFSLISHGKMSVNAWWTRHETNAGVFWTGKELQNLEEAVYEKFD